MSYKIIITGCTGSAGSEAIRQALLDPQITRVTCLTRRPPSKQFLNDPKLNVVIHEDFGIYPEEVMKELRGHNGVIWDLGITGRRYKGPESTYRQVTVQYPLAAAKAFSTLSQDPKKKFVFAFLTNIGADQDEETIKDVTKPNYVRIRGEAERALSSFNLPTLQTYIFRPGMIGLVSPTPEATLSTRLITSLVLLARPLAPHLEIDSDILAKGMIRAVKEGSGGRLEGWEGKGMAGNQGTFENEEIKRFARGE